MHGGLIGHPLDNPVWITWGSPEASGQRQKNFIRPPRTPGNPGAPEVFLAGGLILPSGEITPNARLTLHRMMTGLEARMWRSAGDLWSEPLAGGAVGAPIWENPSLPSGFAYLLQFIAHDMVDTVRAATIHQPNGNGPVVASPEFRNSRFRALMLDTIYGEGPDERPEAYSFKDSTGDLPRTLLRTGPLRGDGNGAAQPPATRTFCPFRDLARAAPPPPLDETAHLTEVLASDSRNDAHALISQMTVLFHLLHNTILGLVAKPPDAPNSVELAYRRFLCVRYVVTLIYRNLIEKDVLARILNRSVYDAYARDPGLRLHSGNDVPVEFSAGAFRFAHSLVREFYDVNTDSSGLRFIDAIEQSAKRNAARVPVSRQWAVDWALFFDEQGTRLNRTRRIGPFYAGALMNENSLLGSGTPHPPSEHPLFSLDDRGLPARDFLTGAHSGMWSTPALIGEVRRRLVAAGLDADIVPRFNVWKEALRTWLDDAGPEPPKTQAYRENIERLVKDPPLLFFVLFEAAHEFDPATGKPRPATRDAEHVLRIPGQGGRRLGPLGSILVADSMFAALRSAPFGFQEAGLSLRERIEKVSAAFLGNSQGMHDITLKQDGSERRLDTMLDLLTYMRERGAFAAL